MNDILKLEAKDPYVEQHVESYSVLIDHLNDLSQQAKYLGVLGGELYVINPLRALSYLEMALALCPQDPQILAHIQTLLENYKVVV